MKSAHPRLIYSHMNCPPCTCGRSQTWIQSVITTWMAQICTLRSHVALIEDSQCKCTHWHHFLDFMSKMVETCGSNSRINVSLEVAMLKKFQQLSVKIFPVRAPSVTQDTAMILHQTLETVLRLRRGMSRLSVMLWKRILPLREPAEVSTLHLCLLLFPNVSDDLK